MNSKKRSRRKVSQQLESGKAAKCETEQPELRLSRNVSAEFGLGGYGTPEFLIVTDPKGDAATQYAEIAPTDSIQIKGVFFGADEGFGSQLSGFGLKFGRIFLRIPVMVAKKSMPHDLKTPFPQVHKKSRRIADATKSEELFLLRLGE
jgi:hypothetical protein